MKKLNLLVLFGGKSSEHQVSLKSSSAILSNIDEEKYNIIKVGITKQGKWLRYDGDIELIKDGSWESSNEAYPAMLTPEGQLFSLSADKKHSLTKIDVCFPVLHGKNGEDGSMQGLLEIAEIPYVGCDHISSGVCMDKELTHMVLDQSGVKTAKYVSLKKSEAKKDFEASLDKIEKEISYPMFIKPAMQGSSVGVSKAKDRASLKKAVELAFSTDQKLIAEEEIVGKELECAVLGNDEPSASCLGEIAPADEFYSFDAKYNNAETKLFIPARVSEKDSDKIRLTAIKAYKALSCSGFTRMDFFLTKDGEIFLNEPNTIPGFTSISMYPKLWEESGLPFRDLIDRLISLAIEKHRERENG